VLHVETRDDAGLERHDFRTLSRMVTDSAIRNEKIQKIATKITRKITTPGSQPASTAAVAARIAISPTPYQPKLTSIFVKSATASTPLAMRRHAMKLTPRMPAKIRSSIAPTDRLM